VKRNVVELTEVPTGQAGRRSKSLSAEQADDVLTKTALDRVHSYTGSATGTYTAKVRREPWLWCPGSIRPTGPRVSCGTPSFRCSPMPGCPRTDRAARRPQRHHRHRTGLPASDPARHPDRRNGHGSALWTRRLKCVVTHLVTHPSPAGGLADWNQSLTRWAILGSNQ
jgi:hypothetical protein